MHPAYGMLTPGLSWDPPSSLIGGEDLLARLYNAIRWSSSEAGSNYLNTTLLVTFDDHGGTYDHITPLRRPLPTPPHPAGQFGFTFDRSGVRIPTLAISAWIPERTVITEERRSTSLIATMRERWDLGEPFTDRDATARSFNSIFTLSEPREQADWPDITARPVEKMTEPLTPLSVPLNGLGQALFGGLMALGKQMGATVPDLDPDAVTTGEEAIAIAHNMFGDLFPAMRPTADS